MANSYFVINCPGDGSVSCAVMDEVNLDAALNSGGLNPNSVVTDLSALTNLLTLTGVIIVPAFCVKVHSIPTESQFEV